MPAYFLALMPKLDLEFYQQVEKFYDFGFFFDLRLPFHVTVQYFSQLNNSDLNGLAGWMDRLIQTVHGFTAEVQGVEVFRRMDDLESKIKVYYLRVMAPQFIQINADLVSKFPNIANQEFNYIPHLSLIFPHNLPASPKNLTRLNQAFSYLHQLEFTDLALFASQDGVYSLIKKVHL